MAFFLEDLQNNLLPLRMAQLFETRALTGIRWISCQMTQENPKFWEIFTAKCNRVETTETKYDDMEENVLYHMDIDFPLVTLYYKDSNGKLIGIQPDSERTPIPPKLSTYNKFYRKLGTTPETTPLDIYYMFLPRLMDEVDLPSLLGVTIQRTEIDQANVAYHVLVPPNNFAAECE